MRLYFFRKNHLDMEDGISPTGEGIVESCGGEVTSSPQKIFNFNVLCPSLSSRPKIGDPEDWCFHQEEKIVGQETND